MGIAAILLAAGSARRFGGEKLLAPWRGRPLLAHALDALAAAPEIGVILVVVRPDFPAFAAPRCRFVANPDHATGMGSSLRAGVAAAPADAEGYVIALADMPAVAPGTVSALVARFRAGDRAIVVPEHDGRRGHPVVIGRALRAELLAVSGDVGAREILHAHPDEVATLATDDAGVLFDVDRPADLVPPGDGA